jgi:FKBP-type peptidyl-prolyl cis-trans isomerase
MKMSLQQNLKLPHAPKHIVTAHQVQQEKTKGHANNKSKISSSSSSSATTETETSFFMQKKSFPIGSLFSYQVQTPSSTHKYRKYRINSTNNTIGSDDDMEDDDMDDDYDDDDIARNALTIDIPPSTKLSIDSIIVDPSSFSMTSSKKTNENTMSLYISDANEFICLCPYLTTAPNTNNRHHQSMIQNLNLSAIGPNTLQFALVCNQNGKDNSSNFGCVNLFGKVEVVSEEIANAVVDAKTNHVFDEYKRLEDDECALDNENDELNGTSTTNMNEVVAVEQPQQNDKKRKNPNTSSNTNTKSKDQPSSSNHKNDQAQVEKKTKKQKKEESKSSSIDNINNDSTEITKTETSNEEGTTEQVGIQKLTKKQRRKLAKQKAKELEDAVAISQGHSTTADSDNVSTTPTKSPKTKSLTKQRAIKGGILIRDIIHGVGAPVRVGRKISINYVGKFPESDKVFDKNLSKGSPLVFRLGTGEVIKGLDRGMEGMKVGGERVITIPPKLGYGEKGSGTKIPGNSTLCFEVKLLSVGRS